MVLRALAAAAVAVAVFIPLGALISAAPAGADPVIDPAGVSIGNGPQQFNGTYLNAQKIADSLAGAGVTVEATGQITIADPSDLSASPLGTPHFSLTLSAPVCNVDNNLNLGALGNLILDCGTLNFNAQITSGGPAIDPSRVTSTATQVNVLSNAASIQQAIDSSSPASPGTVQVSPGQYAGNLTIGHALTLTGNDGTSATGADPNAPTLAGAQPGGNVITVSADHVTVDGLHLNGTVGASPVSSTSGIFASGVDGLTVTHNTFDGFSGLSITTPGSTNVVSDMNDTIFDPTSVSIGNGTQLINGTYLNCQKITDNLVVTSITIQATGQISVVDPCDLSTSLNGTPHFNLSLVTPTLNINNGLNLAASGNLFLTVSTLNLNAQLTSGGTTIDPSRVTSTATQVNVLSNAASIQQAIDSSSPASADTVQVSPGQYAGNLSIGHALTLTGNDGTSATGADPGAPTLAGTQPGGTVITVTADNVTLDGLDLSGTVAGGSSDSSVYGILASGVDGLTVTHNTFGGFSGLSIATPGSTNVVLNANGPTDTITFDSEGGSTVGPVSGLDGTTVSLPDAPARAGYSFGGWYTAASGGSLATSPYLLAGSATLFAQWTANPKRATSTQVLCSPFSLSTGASTSCTATVTDTDSGAESWPQGAISWDNGGASGNFASSSCTLVQNGSRTRRPR